jgi:hypothetical protein
MDKVIQVRFSDGSLWEIPVLTIAADRARYYALKESDTKEAVTVFLDEIVYTLRSDDTLLDWANNNMDWDDVSSEAMMVEKPPMVADFKAEWSNAEKTFKGSV